MGDSEDLLARVLRRQDELEARFTRIEAALGINPDGDAAKTDPAIIEAARAVLGATKFAAAKPDAAQPAATVAAMPDAAKPAATIADAAMPDAAKPAPPIPDAAMPDAAKPERTSPLAAVLAAAMAEPEVGKLTPVAERSVAKPTAPNLESRVGLAWLNRIGVVTLILGVGFAFKTAVDNNWLGPTGRVLVGIALAIGALAGGDFAWRRRHTVFAQGLTGLGLALCYLTFWASFALYHLVPHSAAFALMVATTIASAMLAIRYAGQAIAVLALCGGYITPVVLSTGEHAPAAFFSYLALLNIGAVVLARKRSWPSLEMFAAVATAILYAGWLEVQFTDVDKPIASLFAIVFYAQFSIARPRVLWQFAQVLGPVLVSSLWLEPGTMLPLLIVFALGGLIVAEVRRYNEATLWSFIWFWAPCLAWLAFEHVPALQLSREATILAPGSAMPLLTAAFALFVAWSLWWNVHKQRALGSLDLVVVAMNPAAYFGASYILLEPTAHAYLGLFAVGLAALYLGLAKVLWYPIASAPRDPRPGMLALGVALTSFTLAVPIQVAGFSLPIAWAIEGAALAWLARRFTSSKLGFAAYVVLGLALLRALDTGFAAPQLHIAVLANLRFVTFAVLAASLFVAAKLLFEPVGRRTAYVLGHVIVLVAIGLEIAGWTERSIAYEERFEIASVSISIMMAIYGLMLVAVGVMRRSAVDRILGLALMGIVVLKLYLSDVWLLGRAFRVAAFLGLGVLLLLVSFVYSRYRSVIERLWKDEPPRR